MLKHYVKFDTPGAFMPESEVREIKNRIPSALGKIPKHTYAIEYFDREIIKKNGETLSGKPKNCSNRIIFGVVFRQDELPSLGFGERTPLYHNAENTNKKVIRCVAGNWQPWDKNWIILPSIDALKNLKEEV